MPHVAYGSRYQRRLAGLRSGPPMPCVHCQVRRATTLDHDPPLAAHVHREGSDCCRLVPSCEACNKHGGRLVMLGRWRPQALVSPPDDEDMPLREPESLSEAHPGFARDYLRALLPIPADSLWPRLMTICHPRAVSSLGDEFCRWAEERSGRELRWWQRLVATRLLEVDADGRLVWEAAIISTARQVGKSWLLRELCLWRIHQGDRFHESQDVLHTGKDIAICVEVQRPARTWAKGQPNDFKVREVNGQQQIERLADGSRWMLRARDAVYGYSVSLGAVDEGWRVPAAAVDEGLTPTMVEREQPQLLLFSTAHRRATSLMLDRRQAAINDMETGLGDLLIEWSAPRGGDPGDRDAWRRASPHWTDKRERMIDGAYGRMQSGEVVPDSDEPDPESSFRAQWLNQWPAKRAADSGPAEPLLPDGVWQGLVEAGPPAVGPAWVGLEGDFGVGAAVGCCRRCPDGRLELDGWLRGDWDSAVADIVALMARVRVRRVLVGATMLDRLPPELRRLAEPRAAAATRVGLALLRDLALAGGLVHDTVTGELDATMLLAAVRENANGLFLVSRGPTHLVKATVWALVAAHRPVPVPSIR